jgi:hypothetical protein
MDGLLSEKILKRFSEAGDPAHWQLAKNWALAFGLCIAVTVVSKTLSALRGFECSSG